MVQYAMHPTGDKMKKAVKEFSELLLESPGKNRWQLLQQIELKYDLSPQECEFLNSHFSQENS